VVGGAAWWPRLVDVYRGLSAIRAEVESLGSMTSPEDAVAAISKVETIHRSATKLISDIEAARSGLAVAVGAQTALRFA
jgi:hypothetical protein